MEGNVHCFHEMPTKSIGIDLIRVGLTWFTRVVNTWRRGDVSSWSCLSE